MAYHIRPDHVLSPSQSAFRTPHSALILNPAAGSGRAGRGWAALAAALAAAGVAFRQFVTCGPGDATLLARAARAAGAGRLIVVGGDGTLNEVVNGCLDGGVIARDAPEVALLPRGTGSDFARAVGLAGGAGAVAALRAGVTRRLDVGIATFRDGAGREATRAFVNVADCGLGPETSRLIAGGPKGLGPAAYFYGALRAIAGYAPTPVRVVVDGAILYEGPSGLVAIGNSEYFGGGMRIAPGARPDDGLLDVLVVGRAGRGTLAGDLLPKVYRGAHLGHPAVRYGRGRVVEIAAAGSFPLELDGEVVGTTPARFAVAAGALGMVLPAG